MDKGCISFIWFQGQGLFFFCVFKCWPELNVYFNISEWTFYLIVLLSLKNEKVKCESSRALNWAASMLNALINQGTLNPDLAFLFQFALIFSLSPGIAPFLIGVPWFYFNFGQCHHSLIPAYGPCLDQLFDSTRHFRQNKAWPRTPLEGSDFFTSW